MKALLFRNLIHSAWATITALVIIVILTATGFLMISTAPLWLWAVPAPTEESVPGELNPAERRQGHRVGKRNT